MAPRPFTPGERTALAYWGVINASVGQRASTADLAAAVTGARQAEADRLGVELAQVPGPDAVALGSIRSLAVAYRDAAARFGTLRDDTAITAAVLPEVPWSRPLADRSATPDRIEVRARYVTAVGNVTQARWITVTYDGNMPATAGGVRDDLDAAAQGATGDYGEDLVGVDGIWLARV